MEESNADKAIKALTAALAPKARVKRNGKVESIEAKELVPGDIVIIQFGNIVPADVKLLGKSGSDEVPMQVGAPLHTPLLNLLWFIHWCWVHLPKHQQGQDQLCSAGCGDLLAPSACLLLACLRTSDRNSTLQLCQAQLLMLLLLLEKKRRAFLS